jgi:hypothetical protein
VGHVEDGGLAARVVVLCKTQAYARHPSHHVDLSTAWGCSVLDGMAYTGSLKVILNEDGANGSLTLDDAAPLGLVQHGQLIPRERHHLSE